MKKRYSLIIIGVVLIIFGALLPTIFKVEIDKLAFYRDMGYSEYTCSITITSKNNYEVSSATVYFEDFFGDKEISKQVSSSSITKSQQGESYVYTFVVQMASFGEYSEFSKIKKVVLSTNLGARTATDSSFKWTTPVMIIMIIAGIAVVGVGIGCVLKDKALKMMANNAREELAKSNPEININNMSDTEILSKQREIKLSKLKENIDFMIKEKPKEKVCEYCGATNSAEATKCSSCGANLKTRK